MLDVTLHTWLVCGIIVMPVLAAALLLASPGSKVRAGLIGALGSGISLALVIWLLLEQVQGVLVAWEWAPALDVILSWRLNVGTLAIAALVAFVGVLIMQFAAAYFGPSAKGRRAIATLSLFEAAMLGLILSDNLFVLFVFWELTGLCSFFLINTDADKRDDTFAAAQQALIVTVGGALPMLIGFIYLATVGSASLTELYALELPMRTQTIAFLLILSGVLTKSAQVPLHFWLPGAMAAPTPISGYLHSATMVKAGLILLIYLFPVIGQTPYWSALLVPIGGATCIWGSYRALGQDDIKLLMAWSTVSQLGVMALTLGLGTDLAIRAGILYLFAHAIFKAGLFISVGGIDHAAHTRLLSELGGLRRQAPALFWVTLILCGSMAGLPPFAGFLSKELVLEKLILADSLVHDVAVIAIVVGSIGTVAYTSRFFFGVFAGSARSAGALKAHAPGVAFLLAPALLATLSIVGGTAAQWIDWRFLEPVSWALVGAPIEAPKLALWHGITVPLLLSTGILAGGWYLYRRLDGRRLSAGPEAISGPVLFERFLAGSRSLGSRLGQALAGASPSVYFGLVMVLGLLWSVPLMGRLSGFFAYPWDTSATLVLIVQLLAIGGLILLPGRLARVLLLSVVGFTVALLYRLINAPDIALTQLLVEVLTAIFFALAIRFIATQESPSPIGLDSARLAVAIPIGLVGASLIFALEAQPSDPRLPDYYLNTAPTVAKGLNVVNVILADFRGLDTLVETIVVVLAGLGVGGLLIAERAERGRETKGSFMIRQLTRFILPIAIMLALAFLLKGHDTPGGGFVSSMAFAVASILAFAAYGIREFQERLPIDPDRLAVFGTLVLVFAAVLPLVTVKPMLTHAHGVLSIFGVIPFKWSSTLLFEIGVVLSVAGGLTAAAMKLWAMSNTPSSGGD
jgi:NADH:ubiquinone oxidoreductase subunit 5 (subunit L)/multisubunit Na+/H+ antiporter MnhA subunit